MPEIVEVIEDMGIIQIKSVGEVSEEDLQKSRSSVSQIIRDRGLSKILVDATEQSRPLPTMTAFAHGSILSTDTLLRGAKHAIVVSELVKNELLFIETVAFNRGARVRVFMSREEALLWLND